MHLHWAWKQGPAAARDVTKGYTLCGKQVPAGQFTSFRDDADCPECLKKLSAPQVEITDNPPAGEVAKDKTRTRMMRAAKKGGQE